MTRDRMPRTPRGVPGARWVLLLSVLLLVCAALSGCSTRALARAVASQAGNPAANRTPVKSEPALAQVRAGQSRDELLALLGPTNARLRLDSGYEVWAYRLPADKAGDPPKGEFVVLLAPSGQVAKTRLRLTPVAAPEKPPLPAEEDDTPP